MQMKYLENVDMTRVSMESSRIPAALNLTEFGSSSPLNHNCCCIAGTFACIHR